MNNAALIAHVVSGSVWLGAVFMASFIDWPTIKSCSRQDKFPFEFVVRHGQRVLPAVYSAIVLLIITSVALVWIVKPSGNAAWGLLAVKGVAFSFMVGSTVYGSVVAWPRLQFANDTEAYAIYTAYINRARLVTVCGVVCTVLGLVLAHIL